MSCLRAFGLILLTALLAAAFAGTPASSATVLCGIELGACPEARVYAAEQKFSAGLLEETKLTMANSLTTIECKTATLSGTSSKKEGEPLSGKVASFELASCTAGKSSCTTKTLHLPFSASFAYSKAAESEGHGTMTLGNGGGGKPAVEFTCGGQKCTYSAEPALAVGGEPALATAEEAPLVREGKSELCAEKGGLTATYEFTEPSSGELAIAQEVAGTLKLCKQQPTTIEGKLKCPAGQGYSGETVSALLPPGAGLLIGQASEDIECPELSLTGKFQENGLHATPNGGIRSFMYVSTSDCTSTLFGNPKVQVVALNLTYDRSDIVFVQTGAPQATLGFEGSTGSVMLRMVIMPSLVCVFGRRRLIGEISNGEGGEPTVLEISARWYLRPLQPIECPPWYLQAGSINILTFERPGGLPLFVAKS